MREEKKAAYADDVGPMPLGGCPECGSRSCVARQCSLVHATSQMSPVAQGDAEDAERLDLLDEVHAGCIRLYGRAGLVPQYVYWGRHHKAKTARAAIDAARAQAKEGGAA